MARAFDHHLHVVFPRHLRQFTQGLQFGQLRFVIGVVNRAGAQAVAEREGNIILLEQFADFLEVRVEEALLVVGEAPLRHDGTAARHNAGHTFGGHRDVRQTHAGVDGKVIHTLLALLDQRVAVNLPGQLFGFAVDFFQGLINRHGADRHRRIADDPLAGFMNVLTGRQIHDGVTAPADRPGHFFDFFLNAGRQRRIADVGIDFHQEVATDDHRLNFRMVDVYRDDRAAAGHFITYEFGCDDFRNRCTEMLTRMLFGQQLGKTFAPLVLADRDVFHLRRNNTFARIVHLRHVHAGLGNARFAGEIETQTGECRIGKTLPAVTRARAVELNGITALLDPLLTQGSEPGADVDFCRGIGVRARGVIHKNRRILFCAHRSRRVGLGDLAHRHLNVGAGTRDVNLA